MITSFEEFGVTEDSKKEETRCIITDLDVAQFQDLFQITFNKSVMLRQYDLAVLMRTCKTLNIKLRANILWQPYLHRLELGTFPDYRLVALPENNSKLLQFKNKTIQTWRIDAEEKDVYGIIKYWVCHLRLGDNPWWEIIWEPAKRGLMIIKKLPELVNYSEEIYVNALIIELERMSLIAAKTVMEFYKTQKINHPKLGHCYFTDLLGYFIMLNCRSKYTSESLWLLKAYLEWWIEIDRQSALAGDVLLLIISALHEPFLKPLAPIISAYLIKILKDPLILARTTGFADLVYALELIEVLKFIDQEADIERLHYLSSRGLFFNNQTFVERALEKGGEFAGLWMKLAEKLGYFSQPHDIQTLLNLAAENQDRLPLCHVACFGATKLNLMDQFHFYQEYLNRNYFVPNNFWVQVYNFYISNLYHHSEAMRNKMIVNAASQGIMLTIAQCEMLLADQDYDIVKNNELHFINAILRERYREYSPDVFEKCLLLIERHIIPDRVRLISEEVPFETIVNGFGLMIMNKGPMDWIDLKDFDINLEQKKSILMRLLHYTSRDTHAYQAIWIVNEFVEVMEILNEDEANLVFEFLDLLIKHREEIPEVFHAVINSLSPEKFIELLPRHHTNKNNNRLDQYLLHYIKVKIKFTDNDIRKIQRLSQVYKDALGGNENAKSVWLSAFSENDFMRLAAAIRKKSHKIKYGDARNIGLVGLISCEIKTHQDKMYAYWCMQFVAHHFQIVNYDLAKFEYEELVCRIQNSFAAKYEALPFVALLEDMLIIALTSGYLKRRDLAVMMLVCKASKEAVLNIIQKPQFSLVNWDGKEASMLQTNGIQVLQDFVYFPISDQHIALRNTFNNLQSIINVYDNQIVAIIPGGERLRDLFDLSKKAMFYMQKIIQEIRYAKKPLNQTLDLFARHLTQTQKDFWLKQEVESLYWFSNLSSSQKELLICSTPIEEDVIDLLNQRNILKKDGELSFYFANSKITFYNTAHASSIEFKRYPQQISVKAKLRLTLISSCENLKKEIIDSDGMLYFTTKFLQPGELTSLNRGDQVALQKSAENKYITILVALIEKIKNTCLEQFAKNDEINFENQIEFSEIYEKIRLDFPATKKFLFPTVLLEKVKHLFCVTLHKEQEEALTLEVRNLASF